MTTPEKFKLYHYPATRSARVKWMLHEVVGDAFDVEVVQLYEGAQYTPAFLQKNPNHAVPVLDVTFADGRTMTMLESGAMVTFLADAYPDKALAPPAESSPERASYLQMILFGASWMDAMLWQMRIHQHVLPPERRDTPTFERYRAKFANEVEPQLIARLAKGPYICGEAFTAADCIIGHNVMWSKSYGLCSAPEFRAYLSSISKRPAFVQAFADAKQFKPEVPADTALAQRFTG